MKKRNLILLLVILPLLLYGGLKGFLWYSIDSTIKSTKALLFPTADVSYKEIRTSVLGPVGVTGLTIKPHGFDDIIKVGSVLARWDKPREILPILEAFYKNTLPVNLNLSIDQIVLSLDGDIAARLGRQELWEAKIPIRMPPSLWGCGTGKFETADLKAMGYNRLNLSVRLEYMRSPVTNTVSFFARARSPDIMVLSAEGSTPSGKSFLSLSTLISSGLEWSSFSFSLDDESYNEKKISYCSGKNGQSPEEFVDDYVKRIAADLEQSNLTPSAELTAAYRSYLTKPARITVNLDPFEPAGMEIFSELGRDNFAQWLGLEVLADEKPVLELLASSRIDAVEAEKLEAEKQKEEQFNPTPVAELRNHLNQFVRIKTQDGKTLYAFIESAGSANLLLTQHLVGGSASFTLDYSDIVEVAVLY